MCQIWDTYTQLFQVFFLTVFIPGMFTDYGHSALHLPTAGLIPASHPGTAGVRVVFMGKRNFYADLIVYWNCDNSDVVHMMELGVWLHGWQAYTENAVEAHWIMEKVR